MFRVYVNFSEGTPRNDCWNGKVVMIDRQILGYPILRQIQPNIGQIGNGKWSINGDFCCIAGKSWSQWFDGKLAWWFDDHHLNMVKKKHQFPGSLKILITSQTWREYNRMGYVVWYVGCSPTQFIEVLISFVFVAVGWLPLIVSLVLANVPLLP